MGVGQASRLSQRVKQQICLALQPGLMLEGSWMHKHQHSCRTSRAGVSRSSAPKARRRMRRSLLMLSGMVSMSLYPLVAAM